MKVSRRFSMLDCYRDFSAHFIGFFILQPTNIYMTYIHFFIASSGQSPAPGNKRTMNKAFPLYSRKETFTKVNIAKLSKLSYFRQHADARLGVKLPKIPADGYGRSVFFDCHS